MQSKCFDILTVNETRLDKSVCDYEVEIPVYDIIRLDRNRNRGWVAMFIRKNIPYIIRHDLVPDAIEMLCIEVIKAKSKPLLIATWYRTPNSSHDLFHKFENFLKLAEDENMEIIITGDLNCNFLEMPKAKSHAN
jgi:exonuclease III